jgi:hypothetical protein
MGLLSSQVADLTAKLSPQDAKWAFYEVLPAIRKDPTSLRASAFANCVSGAARRLTIEDANAASAYLFKAMTEVVDRSALAPLAQAFVAVAWRLGSEDSKAATDLLIRAMKETPPDTGSFTFLRLGLERLAQNETEEDARSTVYKILEVLHTHALEFLRPELRPSLAAAARRLNEQDNQKVSRELVEAMQAANGPTALIDRAQELVPVVVTTSRNEIQDALSLLIQAIGHSSKANELTQLCGAVVTLVDKSDGSQARPAFDAIMKTIQRESDDQTKRLLAMDLSAVAGKLPDLRPEDVDQELQLLVSFPRPSCSDLLPLLKRSTLPRIIEVLKWPTCDLDARNNLLQHIGELEGQTFGRTVDNKFSPDIWAFAAWAENAGFDFESLPSENPRFDLTEK